MLKTLLLISFIALTTANPVDNGRGVSYEYVGESSPKSTFNPPPQCMEARDVGEGTEAFRRWFYNPSYKTCLSFVFKGEGGNANRFNTQLECLTQCTEDPCRKSGNDGSKLGALLNNGTRVGCSYALDTNNDNCPEHYYCAFEARICCRQESLNGNLRQVCDLPKDEGVNLGSKPVYSFFYNATSRQCEHFLFKGAGGNQNRFSEKYECENACMTSTCPVGHPFSKARGPILCTPDDDDDSACPEDYHCVHGGEIGGNVCCLKARNLPSGDDDSRVPSSSAGIAKSIGVLYPLFAVCALWFV